VDADDEAHSVEPFTIGILNPDTHRIFNIAAGLPGPYGTGTGGTAAFAYENSQRPLTFRAEPTKAAWATAVQSGFSVVGSMATLK